jgi:hypothetical protein
MDKSESPKMLADISNAVCVIVVAALELFGGTRGVRLPVLSDSSSCRSQQE